jgi:uncharacterized membrane protein YdjX (TVP38/TMEM64 family)
MYRPPSWVRILLLCLLVSGVAAVSAAETASNTRWIGALIERFGPLVPLAFMVVHVLASVATMLFGFWAACGWAMLGSTAGAVAGFLIARYINSGLIVPEEMKRIGPLLERAEEGGWRAVTIVRLLPLLPHSLINYAFGLTRLSASEYTLGSIVGMLPETYVFVNLAVTGRRALDGGAWLEPMVWGVALIVLSVFVPRLLRRWVR